MLFKISENSFVPYFLYLNESTRQCKKVNPHWIIQKSMQNKTKLLLFSVFCFLNFIIWKILLPRDCRRICQLPRFLPPSLRRRRWMSQVGIHSKCFHELYRWKARAQQQQLRSHYGFVECCTNWLEHRQ